MLSYTYKYKWVNRGNRVKNEEIQGLQKIFLWGKYFLWGKFVFVDKKSKTGRLTFLVWYWKIKKQNFIFFIFLIAKKIFFIFLLFFYFCFCVFVAFVFFIYAAIKKFARTHTHRGGTHRLISIPTILTRVEK